MQLLLLLSLFFFSIACGSPPDVLYIEKLSADQSQALDNKDFAALKNIYAKNAVYNPGLPAPNTYGVDKIQALLASFFPKEVISQNLVSTESITLQPPFDEQGAAGTATGVVYLTVSYIGQGATEGQALVLFAKFNDKYVKTGDFAFHGGWRISQRFFTLFGSPVGNQTVLPASLRG